MAEDDLVVLELMLNRFRRLIGDLQRGEITLIVQGAPPVAAGVDQELVRRAVALLAPELPPGKAAAIVAQLTGAKRSEVYELLVQATQSARSP